MDKKKLNNGKLVLMFVCFFVVVVFLALNLFLKVFLIYNITQIKKYSTHYVLGRFN